MARKDLRGRCTPPCGTLLRAVRRPSGLAPGSAARTLNGKPQTSRYEIAAANSFDRPDPRRSAHCDPANSEPFPYQAAAVGLLWLGTPNLHQRGIPLRRWPIETLQKDPGHPWAEP